MERKQRWRTIEWTEKSATGEQFPKSGQILAFDGEMASTNHFPLDTSGDDGGAWFMSKLERKDSPGLIIRENQSQQRVWGEYILGGPLQNYTTLPFPGGVSDAELDAKGTTAIARTEPTNPAFSVATTIGELRRDGLPSLVGVNTWRSRTLAARNAGDEYLNVQFGWLPLVSDIRKFAHAVVDSEDILSSYHQGSGDKIRRRFYFPSGNDSKTYQGTFGLVVNTHGHLAFPAGTQLETTLNEMWFSGAFRYHLPTNTEQLGKFKRWASDARKLLGIEITPEVVWNLSPWTWAIDWFTNTGDVLHNISAMGRDGLVLQYGYMMHLRAKYTHRNAILAPANGRVTPVPSSCQIVNKTCVRKPATPYGFGVDLNSLSTKQTAILVALGLSRT